MELLIIGRTADEVINCNVFTRTGPRAEEKLHNLNINHWAINNFVGIIYRDLRVQAAWNESVLIKSRMALVITNYSAGDVSICEEQQSKLAEENMMTPLLP